MPDPISTDTKASVLSLWDDGHKINDILRQVPMARQTLYNILREGGRKPVGTMKGAQRRIDELEIEVATLEAEIAGLKKQLGVQTDVVCRTHATVIHMGEV